MTELMIDRHYLKVGEVAHRLSLDESTIYKMIKAGELPSVRIGAKAVRVPASALDAYLRQRTAGVEDQRPESGREDEVESLLPLLEQRVRTFQQRVGRDPESFSAAWRGGELRDTPESADDAIEAFALVAALDRVAGARRRAYRTPDELARELGIDREEVIRVCIEHGVAIRHGRIDKAVFEASLGGVEAVLSSR